MPFEGFPHPAECPVVNDEPASALAATSYVESPAASVRGG